MPSELQSLKRYPKKCYSTTPSFGKGQVLLHTQLISYLYSFKNFTIESSCSNSSYCLSLGLKLSSLTKVLKTVLPYELFARTNNYC